MKHSPDTPFILLALSTLSLVVVLGLVAAASVWGVVWNIISIVVLVIVIILGLGLLSLFLALKGKLNIPWLQGFAHWAVNALFPFALTLGKLFGISEDAVRRSYVAANNQVAVAREIQVQPDEILVMLPQCIQWSDCKVKITNDVSNCRRCGRCVVGELVELRDKHGVHMFVATGGTLARRVVKDIRPKAIVGVACERDLVSGMRDVSGIHVIALPNERPYGPCFNTTTDVDQIEDCILTLLQ